MNPGFHNIFQGKYMVHKSRVIPLPFTDASLALMGELANRLICSLNDLMSRECASKIRAGKAYFRLYDQ